MRALPEHCKGGPAVVWFQVEVKVLSSVASSTESAPEWTRLFPAPDSLEPNLSMGKEPYTTGFLNPKIFMLFQPLIITLEADEESLTGWANVESSGEIRVWRVSLN